jgi:metal-responsive CopG/Arc/MetJ family transcriptional regulator
MFFRKVIIMSMSKIHLTIPSYLASEVTRIAGERGRSKFITEALTEKIQKEKFKTAVKECAGAWKSENHSELTSEIKISEYVDDIRKQSSERLKRTYEE